MTRKGSLWRLAQSWYLKPHMEAGQHRLLMMAVLILYVISVIHGLRARRTFLWMMEARALGASYEELVRLDRSASEENSVLDETGRHDEAKRHDKTGRRRQVETVSHDETASHGKTVPSFPSGRDAVVSGRDAAVSGPPERESKVTDLNSASESELAGLPGVGVILAKKARRYREDRGGFRTVDEFFEVLRLPPHAVDRLRPLVTVSSARPEPPSSSSTDPASTPARDVPPPPPFSPPSGGRVVDY